MCFITQNKAKLMTGMSVFPTFLALIVLRETLGSLFDALVDLEQFGIPTLGVCSHGIDFRRFIGRAGSAGAIRQSEYGSL